MLAPRHRLSDWGKRRLMTPFEKAACIVGLILLPGHCCSFICLWFFCIRCKQSGTSLNNWPKLPHAIHLSRDLIFSILSSCGVYCYLLRIGVLMCFVDDSMPSMSIFRVLLRFVSSLVWALLSLQRMKMQHCLFILIFCRFLIWPIISDSCIFRHRLYRENSGSVWVSSLAGILASDGCCTSSLMLL